MSYERKRRIHSYPIRSERESNIHSLKTMASVRIALQLWKNHEHPYKGVENESFYYAYNRMEHICKVIEEQVKEMELPRVIEKEIINRMDFKVHLFNCCNFYFQDDDHPADLYEEEFWRNQKKRKNRKRKKKE